MRICETTVVAGSNFRFRASSYHAMLSHHAPLSSSLLFGRRFVGISSEMLLHMQAKRLDADTFDSIRTRLQTLMSLKVCMYLRAMVSRSRSSCSCFPRTTCKGNGCSCDNENTHGVEPSTTLIFFILFVSACVATSTRILECAC